MDLDIDPDPEHGFQLHYSSLIGHEPSSAGLDSRGMREETAGTVRDPVPRGTGHIHPLRDTALQPPLHGKL